jgi:iron complex outermembrane receptor protein
MAAERRAALLCREGDGIVQSNAASLQHNSAYKRGDFMPITNEARSTSSRIGAAVQLALSLAICVIGATAAYADVDAGPAEAAPAPEAAGIAEVVVTAQRREENLSKVPISVTAMTEADIDTKGIKDIADVARFTPGITVDNTGTNNISIRGISSSGGAGTTGIYIDDTPIQMRGLAFNPDEALPKTFDMQRVEVLRGPQGTLFGAGSEGGTVRYITTQPSLTKLSIYSRDEVSYTRGGEANFESGVAVGGPLIDGVLGARATVWYRRDGGWIDRVNPTAADPLNNVVEKSANHADNTMLRLAVLWAPTDNWKVSPSVYFENRQVHDVSNFWPIYSNPNGNNFVSGNATSRPTPDRFYLPALKIQGDFGAFQLISNTSYFHRNEQTGYDGTEYNLGFYQSPAFTAFYPFAAGVNFPLIDANGFHLPAALADYRSPASVDNDQQNFTQEVRLQSTDPAAALVWTTGLFFSSNRQQYLEQIHDPMLNTFTETVFGLGYTDVFNYTDPNTGNVVPVPYDPNYPNDSYFLNTHARDKQYAWFGEGTYAITDYLKATVGLRYSRTEFAFDTETGGPQLFLNNQFTTAGKKENSFTPKANIAWQVDPNNLVYATYAKGFRPGGGNNPVPYVACQSDFQAFGISSSPSTYNSDTVDSYEIGAKNNIDNRIRIATSVYYIKWHNIQQTVVPPTCQISFIANLGEATAKGADIQAEFAITEALSAELSAGYTEARYTKDSKFSPQQTSAPIVKSGDAIVGESGQPNSPFTAAVGAQYKFTLADHQSFVRIDYEYTARNKWAPARQDPNSSQYDPANFTLSATNFVSMRAGMTLGAWSIEPFVDNLFDTHTLTNYDFSIDPKTPDPTTGVDATRLMRGYTFRPRTVGVTATFRY